MRCQNPQPCYNNAYGNYLDHVNNISYNLCVDCANKYSQYLKLIATIPTNVAGAVLQLARTQNPAQTVALPKRSICEVACISTLVQCSHFADVEVTLMTGAVLRLCVPHSSLKPAAAWKPITSNQVQAAPSISYQMTSGPYPSVVSVKQEVSGWICSRCPKNATYMVTLQDGRKRPFCITDDPTVVSAKKGAVQ